MTTIDLTVANEVRRSNLHLKSKVFKLLIDEGKKTKNNGDYTVDMVNNWFYGRNNNEVIDEIFWRVIESDKND